MNSVELDLKAERLAMGAMKPQEKIALFQWLVDTGNVITMPNWERVIMAIASTGELKGTN